MSTETENKPEVAVRCTGWVAEAEAALAHVIEARKGPSWNENYTAYAELIIAQKCLRTAIESEPRPSAHHRPQHPCR